MFVTKVEPNYSQPWQMCPQRSSTGSAFVIDCGKRMVLTNSHVVSNATAVYLRRPGVAKKYKAEVLAEAKVRYEKYKAKVIGQLKKYRAEVLAEEKVKKNGEILVGGGG